MLPDGLEIIAETEPLLGNQPSLTAENGLGKPILNLDPTDSPLIDLTGEVDGLTHTD